MTVADFDWQDEATCSGKPADWWFEKEWEALAKSICGRCPVQSECLNYALVNGFVGVWGATTPKERRRIRRERGIRLQTRYEGAYRARRTTPRGDAA